MGTAQGNNSVEREEDHDLRSSLYPPAEGLLTWKKILRVKSSAHPQMELVLSPDWNYVTIRRTDDHDDYFQFASVLVDDLISTLQEAQRSLEKKPVVNALEDINLGLLKEKAKKKSQR